MYFNNVNYGTLESFIGHSGIQASEVEAMVQRSNGRQDIFERQVFDYLYLPYAKKTLFVNGKVFKRRQDLADYMGVSPQSVNKSLRMGKTIDDILVPHRSHQLRRRLRTLSSEGLPNIPLEDSKRLRGIHVSKTDAESIMRVFNFDTYEEVYNFVRYTREQLRKR